MAFSPDLFDVGRTGIVYQPRNRPYNSGFLAPAKLNVLAAGRRRLYDAGSTVEHPVNRLFGEEGEALLDFKALGWCALAVIIAGGVIDLLNRWWRRRVLTRPIGRMKRNQERGKDGRPRLIPESIYIVEVSEFGVSCTDPEGAIGSVAWGDLQQVEIVTTDQGPFLPDVFFVLRGSQADCVVPQGATGDRELLKQLQQLQGFRNEAIIDAMSSTDNRRFLCWEKVNSAEQNASAG